MEEIGANIAVLGAFHGNNGKSWRIACDVGMSITLTWCVYGTRSVLAREAFLRVSLADPPRVWEDVGMTGVAGGSTGAGATGGDTGGNTGGATASAPAKAPAAPVKAVSVLPIATSNAPAPVERPVWTPADTSAHGTDTTKTSTPDQVAPVPVDETKTPKFPTWTSPAADDKQGKKGNGPHGIDPTKTSTPDQIAATP